MSLNRLFAVLIVVSLVWPGTARGTPQTPFAPLAGESGKDRPKDPIPRSFLKGAPITNWKVVAVKKNRHLPCPVVDGWTLEESAVSKNREFIAAGLDRFCTYLRTNTGEATEKLPKFPEGSDLLRIGLAKADHDRMAVATASPQDEAADMAGFASQFTSQVRGGDVQLSGEPDVRIVFLDGESTHPGLPGVNKDRKSVHGLAMMELAYKVLCGSAATCPVEIWSQLVLPYNAYDADVLITKDEGNGGNYGTLDDLAEGIIDAVMTWQQEPIPSGGHRKHLILNISVAWDGERFGGLGEGVAKELDAAADRVKGALEFARQSGALVIAAAGNRRGGPSSYLASLPAAWELWPPSWCPFHFGQKLVYAAGGIDWQELPLANAREGGMPQRVVYSDHATTGEKDAKAYTGSSVSASMTSAIAAAVWHLRPELCGRQVMKLLTKSARPLPIEADFYSWKYIWPLQWIPAPHLRRLTLCGAVTYAWKTAPSPWRPGLSCLSSCTGKADATYHLAKIPPDDGMTLMSAPHSPFETFDELGTGPWTGPQPANDPCPDCGLPKPPLVDTTSTTGFATAQDVTNSPPAGPAPMGLQVVLDPAFPWGMLYDPTLRVVCYDGGLPSTTYYSLTLPTGSIGLAAGVHALAGFAWQSPKSCTFGLAVRVVDQQSKANNRNDDHSRSVLIPLYLTP